MKPPRKVSKAERAARVLRQRVAYDRSRPDTTARECHLRALMGLCEPQGAPLGEVAPAASEAAP